MCDRASLPPGFVESSPSPTFPLIGFFRKNGGVGKDDLLYFYKFFPPSGPVWTSLEEDQTRFPKFFSFILVPQNFKAIFVSFPFPFTPP